MLSKQTMSQERRKVLHFLADTITVNANNRILEMGKEASVSYYSFYCKCITPYNSNVSFTYSNRESKADTLSYKPDYKFVSWRDFSDIINREGKELSKRYFIYITELLPNNNYITNKVRLVVIPPPIVDYQIIRGLK